MILVFDIEGASQAFEINAAGDLFRRGRPRGQANYDSPATRMAEREFTGSPTLLVRTRDGQDSPSVWEVYCSRRDGGVVFYRFDLAQNPPRSWQRVSATAGVR
jgi:hypothetical protein